MNNKKDNMHLDFIDDLHSIFHQPFEKELYFFNEISNGNEIFLKEKLAEEPFVTRIDFGILSTDSLVNLKYHLVVTAALLARYCIHKGMESNRAFNLSDSYIRRMDKIKTEAEISNLHAEMCLDFCHKMQVIIKQEKHSKAITQCLDYIYSHAHHQITVSQLAEYVQLSESYLSKHFKEEMNISLTEYILQVKIEEAKNLLRYSEYSIVEIADSMAFSSQSYFTKLFKNATGLTPKKYREKYFHSNWDIS